MSQFDIRRLGPATRPTPLRGARFMTDDVRVRLDAHAGGSGPEESLEQAGPRSELFFDPTTTRCGILTAGGLCPGLNNVIRGLVLELHHAHGTRDIQGIAFGFDGLTVDGRDSARRLRPEDVTDINAQGGSILGTSRGRQDLAELADGVEALRLDVLFVIGGDGSLRGALALDEELARRGKRCAVVGIPKTIDNDLRLSSRSFGYETAVAEAARSVINAHAEARGHANGVGLVKLMGRESGFIAAGAALAATEANFVLIPEVPFALEGEHGLLASLERRVRDRRHAVIVVAEGAAKHVFDESEGTRDSSGNLRLPDVGRHLAELLPRAIAERGLSIQLKYIDPSYDIRAVAAGAGDSILCGQLAKMAVHAAMAGRTAVMVGLWNDMFVHVPMGEAVRRRKQLKPDGLLWSSVLASTGQGPLV
jgi:6-phosphofructokinase 1